MKSSREVREAATLAEYQRIMRILGERRREVADVYLQMKNTQAKDEILGIYHEINDLMMRIRGDFK
jgi:F0F1-type ATP synthase beta subunit